VLLREAEDANRQRMTVSRYKYKIALIPTPTLHFVPPWSAFKQVGIYLRAHVVDEVGGAVKRRMTISRYKHQITLIPAPTLHFAPPWSAFKQVDIYFRDVVDGEEVVDGGVDWSGSYEAEKDGGDEQKLESHFLYWIGEGFGK
jgi:hypothetical protein